MSRPSIDASLPPRPKYDLTTAKADYPEWRGKPKRSILVCTHPRSGSTLLGEAMYATGRLGCPLEYFHRGFQPDLVKRWQAADFSSYLDAIYRFRTDPTGTLSVKLFWWDVQSLCLEAWPDWKDQLEAELAGETSPPIYHRIYDLLAQLFPNPRYVYLRRFDRLRQAVSLLRAMQTGVYRQIHEAPDAPLNGGPEYDYQKIIDSLAAGDYVHSHWEEFFRTTSADLWRVSYEDLTRDYDSTIRGLFAFLGAQGARVAPPRLQRQADRISEEFLMRFLREYRNNCGAAR